jgi:small-conductance mechanosensitive channel
MTASLGSGCVAAVVLRIVLRRLRGRAERGRWRAEDLIVTLLAAVLPASAVVVGLWATVLASPLTTGWRYDADRVLLGAIVVIVTLGVAKVAGQLVHMRALSHSGTSGSASIFVNITKTVVLALGLLLLLNSLGIAITPLLTALGVGGLAVALALQDTLSNLFAGVHILASHQAQPGAYILLDNGMEGYVEDTNWRNTVIRQTSNNLVVVPNATLAASILTNYYQPDQETSVVVQVGVSYDSDLEHVEQVTLEVAREVMASVEGAVPEYEPIVRYIAFGDSSIDFNVILRASEATKRGMVVHEFIKRVHRRYQSAGVDIPYSVQTVLPAESPVPELLATRD